MAIKPAPKKKKNYSGTVHAHGCFRCRVRYEDVCTSPDEDSLCAACQGLQPWQDLIDSRSPKDCCISNVRLCDADDRVTYRLSASSTWWRCLRCCRTHPFDPRPKKENAHDLSRFD